MAAIILCPNCHGKERTTPISLECIPQAKMWGIIQCTVCEHKLPITIENGYIQKLDISMPGIQSNKLTSLVPSNIKEDIEEAERANYSQCYRACVAMCRRALQLSLIDKGVEDKPLGKMLEDALAKTLLTPNTYTLAKSIKGYGDIGVHRAEELEPKEVEIAIYMAVKMLNEIFK